MSLLRLASLRSPRNSAEQRGVVAGAGEGFFEQRRDRQRIFAARGDR